MLRKLKFLTPRSVGLTKSTLRPYLSIPQEGLKRKLTEHWVFNVLRGWPRFGFFFFPFKTPTTAAWQEAGIGQEEWWKPALQSGRSTSSEKQWGLTSLCYIIHHANGLLPGAGRCRNQVHYMRKDPPSGGREPLLPLPLSPLSLPSACRFCNPLQCSKGQRPRRLQEGYSAK